MDPIALLTESPVVRQLIERTATQRRVLARGGVGSSTACLAGALARLGQRPVLLMVAHVDDADTAEDELRAAGVKSLRFPALETLPGETSASIDLLAERLRVVEELTRWLATPRESQGSVLVAPIQALMQGVPSPARLQAAMLTVQTGDRRSPQAVIKWLESGGYRRADAVQEPGDYAIRGGILDIFPPGEPRAADAMDALAAGKLPLSMGGVPVRLDFFGDEVERVTEIDPDTMGADRAVAGVRLVCASIETVQAGQQQDPAINLLTLLPPQTLAILSEVMELTEQGRGYFERLTDSRGIFGPPAVFKLVQERCASVLELTTIGQYASGERDGLIDLPVNTPPPMDEDAGKAVAELAALASGRSTEPGSPTSEPMRVVVYCQNAAEQSRLHELIEQQAPEARGAIESAVQFLNSGFVWSGQAGKPTLLLPYGELLHRFTVRRRAAGGRGIARLRVGRAMDTFLDLQVGDYVVHNEHGIALFTGLRFMKVKESQRTLDEQLRDPTGKAGRKGGKEPEPDSTADDVAEFITLEFDGKAKLHVPCINADLVQKYIGGFKGGKPPLSILGGQRWQKQKERVKDSVKDLAATLLRVRAGRESMPGIRYPADTAWQKEFEGEFPYEETEDQVAALAEIKKDMQSARPMDRLLCGDVGYGKTELAIRAAFKAVEYGKQAAVLVPTTVLAEQHERTFAGRFKDYPFKVASLSRFKTDAEIRETLELLKKGQIDVVIGTHRLLSKDVQFADLGIVVIDEEQRFGVEHKEKLLSLRMTVDVLTLSATPIPRTLHMSMLGLRDISSLATAPTDRRAVVTEVAPYNETRLKQIIARELSRDGQVFFVHNRVHNIKSMADDVQRMAPDARIVIGHGQMGDGELEQVMLKFMRRQADILVCTTIIESGIDIPTANTIIINDADRFGLAELHQLRGRVGRSKHRGYCYLLLPHDRPLREVAKKRLKAIEQYSMLGAGFKIAMRDLEIRGAGNILGPEQSGHIAAVGYDMYCQLLDRSVKELRNEITATPSDTTVEIGVIGCIPKPYIPSDIRRLEAYRRIALASSADELSKVEADLSAAYGEIPPGCERLLQLAEVRIGARLLGVRTVKVKDRDVIIRSIDPQAVSARLADARGRVSVLPVRSPDELPEIYYRPDNPQTLEPGTLMAVLRKRIGAARTHVATATRTTPHLTPHTATSAPNTTHAAGAPSLAAEPPHVLEAATGFGKAKTPETAQSVADDLSTSAPAPNMAKAKPILTRKGLLEVGGTGISPAQKPPPGSVPVKKPEFKPKANLAALKKMMKDVRRGSGQTKPPATE